MKADLEKIYSKSDAELNFEGTIPFNKERFKDFDIIDLEGEYKLDLYNYDNTVRVNVIYEGIMTTSTGKHRFQNAYDEDLMELLGQEVEILDIYEFLWQNIILEVPLN